MPNLVGQCEMGHGGRHAVAVVDESDDAGVEALEGLHPLSALRLRVTLVRLTNSTRRAYKNQHTILKSQSKNHFIQLTLNKSNRQWSLLRNKSINQSIDGVPMKNQSINQSNSRSIRKQRQQWINRRLTIRWGHPSQSKSASREIPVREQKRQTKSRMIHHGVVIEKIRNIQVLLTKGVAIVHSAAARVIDLQWKQNKTHTFKKTRSIDIPRFPSQIKFTKKERKRVCPFSIQPLALFEI